MSNRYVLILLFMLSAVSVHATEYQLLDNETKKPIVFATFEYGEEHGYTDLNGKFHINVDTAATLILKSFGYQTLSLEGKHLPKNCKIYMKASIYKLDAVRLTTNKPQMILKAGNPHKTWPNHGLISGLMFLTQVSSLNSEKSFKIERVKFFFNSFKRVRKDAQNIDLNLAFRLIIFDENFEVMHEKLLLSSEMDSDKHVIFELTNQQVFIEHSSIFFIGIENIGLLNSDGTFNARSKHISLKMTDKVFQGFSLNSFLKTSSASFQELYPMSNIYHNAYKDGSITSPTGLPPTETYNLNPKMEFTVTEYEK